MLTHQKIDQIIEDTARTYQDYYLDWLNDFLTIEGYARYYQIPVDEAKRRVAIGRKIHKQKTEK